MTSSSSNSSSVTRLDLAERTRRSESLTSKALRRLRRDTITLIALAVVIVIALLAIFADVITANVLQTDAETTNPAVRLLPPGSPGHILGTDDLGRDYAARLLYGGRISLAIGVSGTLLTFLIGIATGLIAGYYGGWIDDVMNWIITTLDSIPSIYALLLLSTILTRSPVNLVIVVALFGWTGGTRLLRGQTIALRNQEFVIAARAMGASGMRIMFVHILPNTLSLILLSLGSSIGGLILSESTLSFLGFGIQPPTPTWGNMLGNAQQFFSRGPHMATISGLLIFITVLCLFVISDGLRDAFDPQARD